MFSPKSLQNNFLCNLNAVLEKSMFVFQTPSIRSSGYYIHWIFLDFISEPERATTTSKEQLLNSVITLHLHFQQGFLAVSKFLRNFLRTWDGLSFKNQIFMLLEWFVFQSVDGELIQSSQGDQNCHRTFSQTWYLLAELRDNLLKPLYTLFIIGDGDANNLCDILACLTNLISNLVTPCRIISFFAILTNSPRSDLLLAVLDDPKRKEYLRREHHAYQRPIDTSFTQLVQIFRSSLQTCSLSVSMPLRYTQNSHWFLRSSKFLRSTSS